MIGTSDHSRTRRITSLPSPSGRPRSSTTISGDLGGDPFQRLRHGAGSLDVVAVGLQRRLEKAKDRRLVVDDQHAGLAGHGDALRARERQDDPRAARRR